MNMRLFAMISSITVLVSATSSSGTGTSTSIVAGNGVNTFSAAPGSSQTALKVSASPSPSTSHETSSSLLTQSQQNSGSTQPTLISTMSIKVNKFTNASTTHIPNTNSPSQQPNESEEQTTQVQSVTTAPAYVPDATIQTTTAFPCDCSKYLTTSTASVSNQTETKTTQPISASTASITSAFTTTTSPTLSTNSTTSATMSSKTYASTLTNTITTSTTTIPTTTNTTIPTTTSSTITTTTTTTIPTTTSSKIPTTTATTIPTTTATTIVTTTSSTIPTTAATTIPTTTATTVATTTSSTIPSTSSSTIHKTSKNRRRRGVLNTEVDNFQSEVMSFVDDVKSEYDHCLEACNLTMNDTTAVLPSTTTTEKPTTTTPKPTTTTPRHRSIDLSGKSVVLQLVIVVNDTFTSDMGNESSTVYTKLAKQYKASLKEYYSHLLPAKHNKIVILEFSNGSIYCNYTLEMDAPINKTDATSTLQKLRELSWNNASLTNLTLDVNKTATEQALLLSNDSVFLPANVCVNNEVLEWDNTGNPICIYKCDTQDYKGKCGDHEECSFTYGGTFRCICKDGYSGNKCETPKPTTTTAKPIKPDAIALSKIDIIGIAAGIGGGLVLILLVALCCVYTKLNKAKKRDRFYGYMDNDKEFLHDKNSRIENVPDLKNEYTNLGYQTEQNELQMQRFEPEGKNVEYEPGQRQGAYERDDKAYRQVEEPEGGNVLIYQPKHLNGPMERQSGASKFDEVEERSNPYRMMDTDTTYKIRRPTVNSDRNVPYN